LLESEIFIFWRIFLSAILIVCANSAALAANEAAGLETLSGEKCELKALVNQAPGSVFVDSRQLLCGGVVVGRTARLLFTESSKETGKPQLERAFNAAKGELLLNTQLNCESERYLPRDGKFLLALPCRNSTDGWPILLLAQIGGGTLNIVQGPASAYPALLEALGLQFDANRITLAAEVRALWSTPIVIGSQVDQALIRELWSDARLAKGRFAYAEAEQALRRALEVQIRIFGEDDVVTNALFLDMAMVVANLGRFDESDGLLRRAAPIIERSPSAAERARLAAYRANISALRGDFIAARSEANDAVAQWRAITDARPVTDDTALARGEMAMALNLEAFVLMRSGDTTSANVLASEALLALAAAPAAPVWWRSDIMAVLGETSLSDGRLAAAETYFKTAIRIRKDAFGEGAGTLRLRTALARAYQAEDMNTNAIIAYREALTLARGLPRDSLPFTDEDLMPLAAAVVNFSAGVTDEKQRQGLFTEVFDAFQFARKPGRDRTVALTAMRLSSGSVELSALLRRIDDESREMARMQSELAQQQALAADDRNPEAEDALIAQIAAQAPRIVASRAEIATRFPDYQALTEGKLPQLDDVRSRLEDDEALVTFLLGRDKSFVQLIRRDGTIVAEVPAGAEDIAASVKNLRRGLEIEGRSVADFDLQTAHQLFSQLLGPVVSRLGGIKRLIIVPSGALASLPFGLLVTEPVENKTYSSAAWLSRQFAITNSPSIASFIALRSTRLVGNPRQLLLAVANPVLAPIPSKGPTGAKATRAGFAGLLSSCRKDAPASPETLRMLSALPETASEVAAVAAALKAPDAEIMLAENATEANLRSKSLSDYRILYFATHGVLPGELKCESEPGLVLTPPATIAATRSTDGLLDASEIAALELRADLVVLSACNTASDGSGKLGGETLSGLAEAFFYAGARSLLVSHWQVPSAATARLMIDVFKAVGADPGLSIDKALAQAQLKAIANPASSHPFFWGAFVLIGDGASSPLNERSAT
jgi:CHAT domain-containing protein